MHYTRTSVAVQAHMVDELRIENQILRIGCECDVYEWIVVDENEFNSLMTMRSQAHLYEDRRTDSVTI